MQTIETFVPVTEAKAKLLVVRLLHDSLLLAEFEL